MDRPSIIDPTFLNLPREVQNELLLPVVRKGKLVATLAEPLMALPWDPEGRRYQDLWLGLSALALFEGRITRELILPHIRVYLELVERYRREVPVPADDAVESAEELWTMLGLAPADLDEPQRRWPALTERILMQAGPGDWQRAMGAMQAARRLGSRVPEEWARRLAAIPAAIVLGSREQRRPLDLWRDTWNRTTYHASDLFYHDSRLRRALLDLNLVHAYRLVAVLAKAGKRTSELVGAVLRASYDIDFASDETALGMFVGAAGLLESSPLISADQFRLGLAKLVWDLAQEPKKPHERIFYDEISLIKSREIILDFRKAMLRSDFLQAWGFAEYAFVHGFEPLELFDEIVRLSPSFCGGGPELLWIWDHLSSVEALLKLLPEDYGIYVMAHTVRIVARTAKNADLLDPFPDEEQ